MPEIENYDFGYQKANFGFQSIKQGLFDPSGNGKYQFKVNGNTYRYFTISDFENAGAQTTYFGSNHSPLSNRMNRLYMGEDFNDPQIQSYLGIANLPGFHNLVGGGFPINPVIDGLPNPLTPNENNGIDLPDLQDRILRSGRIIMPKKWPPQCELSKYTIGSIDPDPKISKWSPKGIQFTINDLKDLYGVSLYKMNSPSGTEISGTVSEDGEMLEIDTSLITENGFYEILIDLVNKEDENSKIEIRHKQYFEMPVEEPDK